MQIARLFEKNIGYAHVEILSSSEIYILTFEI
jgi:hypothetical protein